jgi:hypothetical protein
MRDAPDYADAMFNLALVLQRNNKHAEAAEYWRRYLANDAQSEWAARAPKILRNATATLLIAAVFQVAACNATRRPWRGRARPRRERRARTPALGTLPLDPSHVVRHGREIAARSASSCCERPVRLRAARSMPPVISTIVMSGFLARRQRASM